MKYFNFFFFLIKDTFKCDSVCREQFYEVGRVTAMINLKTNELDLKSKDCKAHLKKLTRRLLNDSGDLLFMQPLFALGANYCRKHVSCVVTPDPSR